MGYKPTLILFLISLLSSFEGFAADLDVSRPHFRGNWVRVPKGVNRDEVISEIKDKVSREYACRLDEKERLHPKEVFFGYDYAPCAPFDGEFLRACHAKSGASRDVSEVSDVNVLLFESVRAGDLYWKVPFTGVKTAYLPFEVGLQEKLEGLRDLEFLDNARIGSEPEEMMFSLEGVDNNNFEEETPAFSVGKHLKIIKILDEILVDIIAAPHKIDTMTADDTEFFLKEMFAHLREGGEIHLLWKYFQKPEGDKDYKIFSGSKEPRVKNKSFETVKLILEKSGFMVAQPTYITGTLAGVLDSGSLPDNYFISVVAKKN